MAVVSFLIKFLVAMLVISTDGADNETTLMSTTTAAPTTTSEQCMDTIPDCHYHRKDEICQGIYKPWATARCARYCGFCTGSGGTEDDCVDTITTCAQYQPCNNPRYYVWVEDHCRKYCHHCGPTTPANKETTVYQQTTPTMTPSTDNKLTITSSLPPAVSGTVTQSPMKPTPSGQVSTSQGSATCSDKLPFCSRYSRSACSDDRDWAITYCPHYCDICDAVNALTATTRKTGGGSVTATAPSHTGAPPSDLSSSTSHPSTSAGASSSSCKDQLPTCSYYSKSACNNTQWGRTYCASFCNLCLG